MDTRFKQRLILIAFGVSLFALLMNFGSVIGLFSNAFNLVSPVIFGFAIAFILNVPMSGFERLILKITSKTKRPPKMQVITVISLILTALALLLVVAVVCTLVIPALVSSVLSLYHFVVEKWPEWMTLLKENGFETSQISGLLENPDLKSIIERLSSTAGTMLSATFGAVSTVVSSMFNFLTALIVAVYALLAKRTLARQSKKVLSAFCSKKVYDKIIYVARMLNVSYSKFLSGQCVEACILGSLIFIALSIFRIPYAGLIGVLTAVMAFVPYVGAFGSCIIGAFLVLLVQPSKFLLCILVYITVQFIENQFIYPHVVGSSVGMSPLWTIIALLIGGNLFGLFGMVFFIPLMAVILVLARDTTNWMLKRKKTKLK